MLATHQAHWAPCMLVNLPVLPPADTYKDRGLGFCCGALCCTSDSDPYSAFSHTLAGPIFRSHCTGLPTTLRHLVLRYLVHFIDHTRYDLPDLVLLTTENPEEKSIMMTSIAQEYKEEGREEN